MALNCAAKNRIFEGSWVTCLRTYSEPTAAAGDSSTTASAPSRPFLVPPKLTTSTPASIVIARKRVACSTERGGGIGDAGAVEMDEHAECVGLVAQRGDLVGGVQRAEFGGLRDRDHPGLDVVLHALEVRELGELLGTSLRAGGREVDQLGGECPLGRTGLVDGNVRPVGAHDRVVRPRERPEQCRQRDDVRTRAVEREPCRDIGSEQIAEALGALACVLVVAVGERGPLVGREHGLDHRRVGAGGVVAGEGSCRGCRKGRHPASLPGESSSHTERIAYDNVMTQSATGRRSGGVATVHCRWCRRGTSRALRTRPTAEFCSGRCRQWDWVARHRANELELSENELVVTRSELDALHDELYVLACAVDDVERDLAGARAPTARELNDALSWLLDAARPLRNREIGAA